MREGASHEGLPHHAVSSVLPIVSRGSTVTNSASRIALAGFGAWGQMHVRALKAIDGAEIVAVYCHGENSARAAAEQLPGVPQFDDYDRMLAAGGYDVVSVAV